MPQSGKTTVPTCLGAPNQSDSTRPRVTPQFRPSGKPLSSGTLDDRFTVPPRCVCVPWTQCLLVPAPSPESTHWTVKLHLTPLQSWHVAEGLFDGPRPLLGSHGRAIRHDSACNAGGLLTPQAMDAQLCDPGPISKGGPAGTDPTSCCCLSCPTAQSCQISAASPDEPRLQQDDDAGLVPLARNPEGIFPFVPLFLGRRLHVVSGPLGRATRTWLIPSVVMSAGPTD